MNCINELKISSLSKLCKINASFGINSDTNFSKSSNVVGFIWNMVSYSNIEDCPVNILILAQPITIRSGFLDDLMTSIQIDKTLLDKTLDDVSGI